ncbi:MAG: hypothetical protein QM831_43345 [Kofleriaceae bacterium]
MIEALAFGPTGLYSASRAKGKTVIQSHGKKTAALYTTPDTIRALWVGSTGTVHAAGKKHHTNASGEWTVPKRKTGKLAIDVLTMWGTADNDLWVGGVDGEIVHFDGTGWTEMLATGGMIGGIAGTSASEVHFAGNDGHYYWDGDTLALVDKGYFQNMTIADGHVYLCTNDEIIRDGKSLGKHDEDELYGVGVGTAGTFAFSGTQVLRPERKKLVDVGVDPKLLMIKNGEYSTAIASNGTEIAVGSPTTPIINTGRGWKQL